MISGRSMDARFCALSAALILYGLFGSPTPDQPGWIEALIAGLLLLSVSISFHMQARHAFLPLLLVGLTLPLAHGIYAGYAPALILRDIIPFLFLCLPLFMDPGTRAPDFINLCLIVGVCFAARVLGQGLDLLPAQAELLYLANSPLVIFAAIVGLGRAGMDGYHRTISAVSIVCGLGGLICLLAMLIDVQRAAIGAVIMSLFLLSLIGCIRAPRRMIWPALFTITILAACHDVMYQAWQGMAAKTALVGVNARWDEVKAVHDHVGGQWASALFGVGWGGQFNSPAVGGWSVPYTHSLLTYMLLKTGWLGVGVTILALAVCYRALLRHPSLAALALFWAISIPTFLYASYKSLDFGLALVLALSLPRVIESAKKSS